MYNEIHKKILFTLFEQNVKTSIFVRQTRLSRLDYLEVETASHHSFLKSIHIRILATGLNIF